MRDRGLLPAFEPAVLEQLSSIDGPAHEDPPSVRDLTSLTWASIDNDDSQDLDQVTASREEADGVVTAYVAVSDVDALVARDTPIDRHARHNTTSVYTGAEVFPMLPERLSTDLTSLSPGEDRLALVVELRVAPDGAVLREDVYRARVRNRAKLAYDAVGAWLEGKGAVPAAMAASPGVEGQLRAQDRVAQALRRRRHELGALDLETIEPRPVFDGETITDLRADRPNRAKQLIEDFMVAANGATARFLARAGVPSIRRVVRSPERWLRIVALAAEHGFELPVEPDARALQTFLLARREADAARFPDLSLVVVKLMGAGEYVVESPGRAPIGHFGLAVRDYTHSTAPNRRFPDLVTQRLLKAVLAGRPTPYPVDTLEALAMHCTAQEDAANRVERQVRKSTAALLLEPRVGERFDGVVTGASVKGTWVRIFTPPVEGRVVEGFRALEVADKVRVKLVGTDVERGFIDFVRVAD
ncbi:MAG: RNB domain-containing ribonuclease [Planctomycetota bacterium]